MADEPRVFIAAEEASAVVVGALVTMYATG